MVGVPCGAEEELRTLASDTRERNGILSEDWVPGGSESLGDDVRDVRDGGGEETRALEARRVTVHACFPLRALVHHRRHGAACAPVRPVVHGAV